MYFLNSWLTLKEQTACHVNAYVEAYFSIWKDFYANVYAVFLIKILIFLTLKSFFGYLCSRK